MKRNILNLFDFCVMQIGNFLFQRLFRFFATSSGTFVTVQSRRSSLKRNGGEWSKYIFSER